MQLIEGKVNEIKIEVTAEDGKTTKYYNVNVRRLSARDASLADLKCSVGQLDPGFSPDIKEYYCKFLFQFSILQYFVTIEHLSGYVSCDTGEIKITPTVDDKTMKTTVNDADGEKTILLNVGQTSISIEVTSSDGSNKEVFYLSL